MSVTPAAGERGFWRDVRLARRLWPFIHPHLAWLVSALAILPLVSAAQVFETYVIKLCLDSAIVPGRGGELAGLVAGFFALLCIEAAGRSAHAYLLQVAGQSVMFDIREAAYRSILHAPMSFHDRNPTGKLLTRVTSDVDAINEIFASGAVAIFGDFLTLFGIVGMMFWLEPNLAAMILVFLPLIGLLLAAFRRRLQPVYDLTRNRTAAMNAYLSELLNGIEVVKVCRREERSLAEFSTINREFRDGYFSSNHLEAALFSVVEMLESVAAALVLWVAGGWIVASSLTFGTLVAFLRYIGDLFRPLTDMSSKFSVIQAALVATSKVFEVLDAPREREHGGASVETPPPPHGRLALEEVHFAYQGGDDVFRGLELVVEPGEHVAVVGHTGAGKTSLAKLLTGLYEPRQGRITLEGKPLGDYPLQELRQRIVYLPQDQYLFAGPIWENVTLGRTDIDRPRVERALDAVGARPILDRLGAGSDTILHERGSNLSVGERQLISFARALVLDPWVLILDEATSSLDPFLEDRIKTALAVLTRGRTTLTIAHRLSTIRDADRILVFHQGKLAESGSHSQLLGRGGLYSRLWSLQAPSAAT